MKNNKNILYIIIVILIVTIVFLASYIIINKEKNNHNLPVNNANDSTNINQEIVKNAENIINKSYFYEPLVVLGKKNDYYNGNINDLPNQTKLQLAGLYYGWGDLEEKTSDEVLDYFKTIFGKDYTINFEDIYSFLEVGINKDIYKNKVLMKYNSKTKMYIDNENGSGYSLNLGTLIKSKLTNYKEENNEYKLTYKQLFCTNCEISSYSYNDERDNYLILVNIKGDEVSRITPLYDKENFDNGEIDEDDEEFKSLYNKTMNELEKEFDNIEEKLIPVTYTFIMEDNHLVLKNINH